MTETRPDPDALLEQLKRQQAAAARGRLKIFFGASAGVGKTYAMLTAARADRDAGIDVVVGVVETHGRAETARLLDGLPSLPRRAVDYKGRTLDEFDLDAALARHPARILIDEYAHRNVPGSRHPRRWQDVEELLAAGIDVYTTLNVQHLESLNDVVGQITGIAVRETVPDRAFDRADEVSLVDLPPDELIARLHAGKVYFPARAQHALQHFFRKGNLLALRELALRRTADRVDAQMRAYRADQDIKPVWRARERLLIAIGPGPDGERLVRSARRLAADLDADWLAVHVEAPHPVRQPAAQRHRILAALKLARELGAEVGVLAGEDPAATLLAYASSRNVSKLVLGKSSRRVGSCWLRPTLVERLARRGNGIDVYVVDGDRPSSSTPPDGNGRGGWLEAPPVAAGRPAGYPAALILCALVTMAAARLTPLLDLSNVVMLYLMVVVAVSLRFGRGPGALAAFLSVAVFDYFFVPPRLSFSVSDTQYLLTFVVMLTVALTIGQLTARLRYAARIATLRERRTRALYDMSRELAGALTAAQIVEIALRHLGALFPGRCDILTPNSQEQVRPVGDGSPADSAVAQWAFDHQQPAGLGTGTLPSSPALYLPLKAPMRTRGVLALVPDDAGQLADPEQQRMLDSCAAQIGLSLERVHYVEVAQDALLAMESERLRNSVLSAVSHDLRTPLTTMENLSQRLTGELGRAQQLEVARALHQEAWRMNQLVTNLLDMARLQSGVQLNRQWQLLDDVVGSALRGAETALAGHHVRVDLAEDLPPLAFDEVLIERVLVNLLQNAGKYTPPGSTVTLAARRAGAGIEVEVADDGPGLPAGMEQRVFDKFARGQSETPTPGVGLGLAICRAIVDAHGGQITAGNLQPHGACFRFTLPLGDAPALPEE